MKRHFNSLLQHSHADFSDILSAGPRHTSPTESAKPKVIGVQDGYDWLTLIKRESGQHKH